MKQEEGKILGIIGGMGPMASSVFYRMLIEKTPAQRDQDHINTIILSHATMPDRTQAIKEGKLEALLEKLTEDATFLAESGACCIAIPCNTSHVLYEELQHAVSVPILNMVRETAGVLVDDLGCTGAKVGILATDGTCLSGIYQKEFSQVGLIPVLPSPEMQKLVMKIIYEGIKGGNPVDHGEFALVEKEMKSAGCSRVVLACTELSCYREQAGLSDYYVDAMEILAGKAVGACK